MKQSILFVLLLSIFSINASAQVSAVRHPNQDYRDAAKKVFNLRNLKHKFLKNTDAYSARKSEIIMSSVAPWGNGDINKAFSEIRDERFMKDDTGFARRPTWLYPYDGCYARAEVAAQRLELKGFSKPSKVFIFGNLVVKSKDASQGVVTWWYHVVVAYGHQGTIYIFDPALEPNNLLTVQQWSALMGPEEKQFSICDDAAFDPYSPCEGGAQLSYEQAQEEQEDFFEPEKENLILLGKNPAEELGDLPIWKRQ